MKKTYSRKQKHWSSLNTEPCCKTYKGLFYWTHTKRRTILKVESYFSKNYIVFILHRFMVKVNSTNFPILLSAWLDEIYAWPPDVVQRSEGG